MKLIILFGAPATGKMTIGYALQKHTGLRVFHNHMSIEILLNFFDFRTPSFEKLTSLIRHAIAEEVAQSDLPGMIFTYVWALDQPSDKEFIDSFCEIFEKQGAEVCFVELETSLDERLRRNKTPFRLEQKPSKRDVEGSEERLISWEGKYKFNSDGDFFYPKQHLKINNTDLSAEECAEQIIRYFELDEVEES